MNETILIVEDNELSRDMLKHRLNEEHYLVSTAASAKEALNQLNTNKFELILLDLMLPDTSGDQLLTEIKNNPLTKNIPVIIVSANDDREMVLRCIDAGAIDYLTKPYSISIVKKRINRCLKNTKAQPTLSDNATHLKNSTIMLVDDQELNRDVLAHRLKKAGYLVSSFTSGKEALYALSENHFDLILLDIIMPDMSGIEVLKEISQAPSQKRTPIIMITALDDPETINHCMELGADDYILKPFNTVLLKLRIASCLQASMYPD